VEFEALVKAKVSQNDKADLELNLIQADPEATEPAEDEKLDSELAEMSEVDAVTRLAPILSVLQKKKSETPTREQRQRLFASLLALSRTLQPSPDEGLWWRMISDLLESATSSSSFFSEKQRNELYGHRRFFSAFILPSKDDVRRKRYRIPDDGISPPNLPRQDFLAILRFFDSTPSKSLVTPTSPSDAVRLMRCLDNPLLCEAVMWRLKKSLGPGDALRVILATKQAPYLNSAPDSPVQLSPEPWWQEDVLNRVRNLAMAHLKLREFDQKEIDDTEASNQLDIDTLDSIANYLLTSFSGRSKQCLRMFDWVQQWCQAHVDPENKEQSLREALLSYVPPLDKADTPAEKDEKDSGSSAPMETDAKSEGGAADAKPEGEAADAKPEGEDTAMNEAPDETATEATEEAAAAADDEGGATEATEVAAEDGKEPTADDVQEDAKEDSKTISETGSSAEDKSAQATKKPEAKDIKKSSARDRANASKISKTAQFTWVVSKSKVTSLLAVSETKTRREHLSKIFSIGPVCFRLRLRLNPETDKVKVSLLRANTREVSPTLRKKDASVSGHFFTYVGYDMRLEGSSVHANGSMALDLHNEAVCSRISRADLSTHLMNDGELHVTAEVRLHSLLSVYYNALRLDLPRFLHSSELRELDLDAFISLLRSDHLVVSEESQVLTAVEERLGQVSPDVKAARAESLLRCIRFQHLTIPQLWNGSSLPWLQEQKYFQQKAQEAVRAITNVKVTDPSRQCYRSTSSPALNQTVYFLYTEMQSLRNRLNALEKQ
jgi:hypothetical protein